MKLTEIIKCNRELGSSLSGNKYKIIVLSDEIYSELTFDESYESISNGINLVNNIIV